MKYLLIIFILTYTAFACSGDCLSCHPALAKTILTDKRHTPMLTCIKCHQDDGGDSACGEDCFACHDIKKIDQAGVEEHKVIAECRACHIELKEKLFALPGSNNFENSNSLKEDIFKLQ